MQAFSESAYKRMKRMIEFIDKRVALFECSDDNCSYSECIPFLLGLDDERWDNLKKEPDELKEYLISISTEIEQNPDDKVKHYFGVIDADEKYVIIHVFIENNGVYGFAVDKTAEVHKKFRLREEMEAVRKSSSTDALTGILNRVGFEAIVRKVLSSCPNQGVLLIMDMDNFKLVNDMLGHPVGDKVLKQFAELLEDFFSDKNGVVGRIGGDEFVVFLGGMNDTYELKKSLAELLEVVRTTFAEEYPEQKLSASIGAVFAATGVNDYESLYKCADNALYTVKNNGKGSFFIG